MKEISHLLIATDLSARSDRAMERGVALALETGARSTIVHVVDEKLPRRLTDRQRNDAEIAIREHLLSLGAAHRPEIAIKVIVGKASRDIVRVARQTAAELIVLGTHHPDTLKDMFRGTTVERVVRVGDLPCLIVKDRFSSPYRRLMVGVDFSLPSRRAVEFALRFVPDGEVYLVHAWHVPFEGFQYGRDAYQQFQDSHSAQLKTVIEDDLSACSAGTPTIHRVLKEGAVLDVLRSEVERLRPDLIVVGTRGRGLIARALLGSIVEDLLRTSAGDVLAVKASNPQSFLKTAPLTYAKAV